LRPAFGPALLCLLFPTAGLDLAERGRRRPQGPFYAGCRNTGTFDLVRTSPTAVELPSCIEEQMK